MPKRTEFLNFVSKKNAELENLTSQEISYDTASSLGSKAITSRQPAYTHAMLNALSREIPLSSKGEIIFEAIKQAYCSVFDEQNIRIHDRMPFLLAQFNLEHNFIMNEMRGDPQFYKDKKSFFSSVESDYPSLSSDDISKLYDFYKSLGGDK